MRWSLAAGLVLGLGPWAAAGALAANKPLTVALNPSGWAPAYFAAGDDRRGLFIEVMEEAASRAKVEVKRVYVAAAQVTELFRKGGVTMELAKNPAWRSKPEDVAVSLWTIPYARVATLVIANAGTAGEFGGPDALVGRKVAVTKGYDYPYLKAVAFESLPYENEPRVIQAVADGEAELGVVGEMLAGYWQQTSGAAFRIKLAGVLETASVSMRIHKSRAADHAALDAALKSMLVEGRLETLHKKWLGRWVAPE